MTTIAPTDANILFSPYTWLVGATAKTINAGAYLRVAFSGNPTTLAATFDVTNQPALSKSRVGFRVDHGPWQDYTVAASVPLTLATGNTWASHTVEMVVIATTETAVRWTAPQPTAVVFTGLVADVAVTTRATRARPLYGLCLGDSITEGVRTLNSTATYDVDRNDSRTAWAYPLTDLLGAEIGVVGFGATGISSTGAGGVLKFPLSAPWLFSGVARSLAIPRQPDFIVAHIGTNDGGAADATVTADTTTLLNDWIAATTATRIFVLAGWNQVKSAAIQAGIAACTSPTRVTFINTTGWWGSTADGDGALHPSGYINITDMAPRLAATLKPLLSSRTFIKSAAGSAVSI